MAKVWDITAWADNSMDWDAWADAIDILALIATIRIGAAMSGTPSSGLSISASTGPTINPSISADVDIGPDE